MRNALYFSRGRKGEKEMTTAEMASELSRDHSLEDAAEIAREIAEIEAKKAAKRAARVPGKAAEKKAAAKKAPKKAAAKKAPKKAAAKKTVTKKAPKKAAAKKAPKAPKAGKVGPTAGILAALKARKAGLTTGEVHGLFPSTLKSDILTRLRRAGLVAKDMADRASAWTITRAGAARLAGIGGAL